ncbi:MAG: hypothetical protein BWZ07_01901 [Alphaproteobacteria bacterium ADurb.BinA280]|nr:MAG: hypothetical protein BWZ07_01901 [Alphaproteobacteria bacterium ADurb.BinA280]
MRNFVAIMVLLSSTSVASKDTMAMFSGEVRIGASDPHAFDVVAAIGDSESVKLESGYVLELNVPSFNRSVVTLKGQDGDVLHTSTFTGPLQDRPSFAYQVCDGGVRFVSPVPADLAACSE